MPHLHPDAIRKIHDALTFKGDPLEAIKLLEDVMPGGANMASDAEKAAADRHCSDEVEVDYDASASRSDEGTWVSAWVWAPKPDCAHCYGMGDIGDGDHPCMKCGGSGKGEFT